MRRLNWSVIVQIIKDEILPYFNKQGVKPTLRTLFYALVSRNVIPNTKSAYKQLSRQLVNARKRGVFSWDFLEDRTRYTLGYFNDSYKCVEDYKEFVKRVLDEYNKISLNALLDRWFEHLSLTTYVGKWARQENIVEIWIEKDALAKTVHNWVADLGVVIRVNRGYSSWTFIYDNVMSIKRKLANRHKRLIVIYLGDLDPSGVDIERFLREAIGYFGLEKRVELVRLAVTPKQVEEFNLPPRPEDAETLRKLERDTRSKKYTYDYIVELDALVVYAPNEFRSLLRSEVLKYWDEELYKELKSEARRLFEKSIKFLEVMKRRAREKIISELK